MKDEQAVKTVMLREMFEGDQPRGRPAGRRSDDVTDWCSCTLSEDVLAVDRKKQGRIILVTTSHVGREF